MDEYLSLKIFTPEGQLCDIECDGVTFSICCDKNGKNEGRYGVKRGHTNAVFALSSGVLTAKKDSNVVFQVNISEGFATIKNNVLTIVTDAAINI